MIPTLHFKFSSDQKGFSLFEVMIAITILSFIMVSVITITETAQNTSDRVITEDRELLQIETAMSRFEWDFSQIYSPLYFSHIVDPSQLPEEEAVIYEQILGHYQGNSRFSTISFDGIPVPIMESEEKTEFVFFTMSNRRKLRDIKQSRFAWVKYSLSSDDQGQVLIREFITADPFSKERIEWDEVKDQVLLRKVEKLSFEFWDEKRKKWETSLRSVKNGKSLIRGVKIKINYLGPDDVELYSERIFRPLFPEFTPEDMYKFLNKNKTPGKPFAPPEGEVQ